MKNDGHRSILASSSPTPTVPPIASGLSKSINSFYICIMSPESHGFWIHTLFSIKKSQTKSQQNLKTSNIFRGKSKNFEEFRGISRDFEGFRWISRNFKEFRGILRNFEGFQGISKDFDDFSRIFEDFIMDSEPMGFRTHDLYIDAMLKSIMILQWNGL